MHKLDLNTSLQLEDKFSEKQMAAIAQSLLELATTNSVRSELSDIDQYVKNFMVAMEEGDPISLEYALLNLYTCLHGVGSKYSPSERELLKKRDGYSCYPGGLSPLIMAEQFIRPESIVADLGAGNGLQGLLLQRICPHRRTLQIELSSEMIRIGRIFQQALGISTDRVEWIHDDIVNVSIEAADFVYIYRPARPLDSGNDLYQAIGRKLAAGNKPLVIFSVADCLAKFLDKRFSVFYTDGHLTCFVKN
ncbi:MAG: class I SAM-dependent methyltransferase [Nitrospirota bacterium]